VGSGVMTTAVAAPAADSDATTTGVAAPVVVSVGRPAVVFYFLGYVGFIVMVIGLVLLVGMLKVLCYVVV
ncbi:hypothetical protein, partial [Streptomyces sp. JV184]|uniref:hypothetical protein n=1 Tax=Streptomyces sp. JV184 TaxID=858637 RepID=UPI002E7979BA